MRIDLLVCVVDMSMKAGWRRDLGKDWMGYRFLG